MEKQLIEKDEVITCLEERINELEKSNEIFKYRIIEIKSISDPKEEEILKLKDNMIELEEEFEKVSKKAHEHEQTISLLKKDNNQMRNSLSAAVCRERKLDKNYNSLIDKLRDATKIPIQEIRKSLMKLLEDCEKNGEFKMITEAHKDTPVDELNRVREHLEVCLKQAVDAGKKN
jgi:chromosome segregation ATPase